MIEAVSSLLEALDASGIKLALKGNLLLYRPVERMSADMLDELRDHKPAILWVLRQRDSAGTDGAPAGEVARTAEVTPPPAFDPLPAPRTAIEIAQADLAEILRRQGKLIGCPSSNLIVRGPEFPQRLVSAHKIPQEAREYHWHGDDWRPIPEHWRTLRK